MTSQFHFYALHFSMFALGRVVNSKREVAIGAMLRHNPTLTASGNLDNTIRQRIGNVTTRSRGGSWG